MRCSRCGALAALEQSFSCPSPHHPSRTPSNSPDAPLETCFPDSPVVGASWEGFSIGNLLAAAPFGTDAYFYRTRAGAEIDLLLLLPNGELWAIAVMRSTTPRIGKGFALAAEDVNATKQFVVHSGDHSFPLNANTVAIPLPALMGRLAAMD